MSESERSFKGIWIPKRVWYDEKLNALDKIILMEIDSLDSGVRGCYASNKHIAEFCQCSETKVSTAITKLKNLGYLQIQNFDGRQRILKSSLSKFKRQNPKNCKAAFQNLKESNILSNTVSNTIIKKESKKESYDEILSAVSDDSLRDLYYEFIKMRKLIKSPMTNRALIMLVKKVNELETSVDGQKALLETAIINNWKSVYPLKQENKKPQKDNSKYALDDMAAIERKKRLDKMRKGQGNE